MRRSGIALLSLTLCIGTPRAFADTPQPDSAAHAVANAARTLQLDSTSLAPRLPDEAEVERLRGESDFNYRHDIQPPESFFEKLLAWLSGFFSLFMHNNVTGDLLPYLLFGAVVLFVIWKVIGAEKISPFAASNKRLVTDPTLVEEDIHAIDFDAAIDQAIAEGRYRRAVRLIYLRLLKQLADKGVIDWRIDKTNHDYLNELAAHDIRVPFKQATRFYEYVWYGDVPIDATSFAQISETFAGLRHRVEELR